jgi:hypothetical protein
MLSLESSSNMLFLQSSCILSTLTWPSVIPKHKKSHVASKMDGSRGGSSGVCLAAECNCEGCYYIPNVHRLTPLASSMICDASMK